jgi:hypothetical protein
MSSRPEFDITLTEDINRIENRNSLKYAGLWIPLITGKDVTTKLIMNLYSMIISGIIIDIENYYSTNGISILYLE